MSKLYRNRSGRRMNGGKRSIKTDQVVLLATKQSGNEDPEQDRGRTGGVVVITEPIATTIAMGQDQGDRTVDRKEHGH